MMMIRMKEKPAINQMCLKKKKIFMENGIERVRKKANLERDFLHAESWYFSSLNVCLRIKEFFFWKSKVENGFFRNVLIC